jgi:hypothetical protein
MMLNHQFDLSEWKARIDNPQSHLGGSLAVLLHNISLITHSFVERWLRLALLTGHPDPVIALSRSRAHNGNDLIESCLAFDIAC